jgi:hypothetical protein
MDTRRVDQSMSSAQLERRDSRERIEALAARMLDRERWTRRSSGRRAAPSRPSSIRPAQSSNP